MDPERDHDPERPHISVRNLRKQDLEAVIQIDARITGRPRRGYFEVKLKQALADTGIVISLGGEVDGRLAGFLLARVYQGEFGTMEPVAVLDTIGVAPLAARRGVGRALLAQLRANLLALGIERIETEVSWDDQQLLSYFHHAGFRPAPRLCLDCDLRAVRARDEAREAAADATGVHGP
jgi:ribosomal protein S18 acetylase RimI-like enzyme